MTPRHIQRRQTLWRAVDIAIFLAPALACWQLWEHKKWTADYSTRPAEATYRWVMAEPPPAGLTGLRVTGRSYLGMKNWVWMRFELTEEAQEKLIERREHLTPAEARKRFGGYGSTDPHYDARDMRTIGWHEVAAIEKPELYQVGSEGDGSPFIWFGVLTLDRKNRRGFIRAWGD